MPVRRLPFLASIALASASAGWIAAVYGALYIVATADLHATGSLWTFGWPFVAALVAASLAHVWIAGGAAPIGIPSPIAWVRDINRLFARGGEAAGEDEATLRGALVRLPSVPVADALCAMVLALAVTFFMTALEWTVSGTVRNVMPIVVGGLIATLLFGASTFTLAELLVSGPCRTLRLAAVRLGLDPYPGRSIETWVRVATFAAPTVLALVVALRLTAPDAVPYVWLTHVTLIVVSTGLCGALAWLQALALRKATQDLSFAASRLARGETAELITGTIDAHLVGMARAFNAAAGEIDRSRQASAARYAALFEGAGDAILLVDPVSGRIQEANRRAHELTGLEPEALKATRFASLLEPAGAVGAADGGGETAALVRRADGGTCPVDVALSSVAVGEGTVTQAILHDVSERERIESELRRSVQRLEELHHLAVTLGGTVEQVADHVAVTLAELLDVPVVAVERFDDDRIVMLAMSEHGTLTHGERFPLAGTPGERVRAEKELRTYTDAALRFPGAPLLTDRGIMTYVGVPIVGRDGEVAGVVCVLDTRVRELREEDTRLLSTFAQRLARAFHEEEYASEREHFLRQLGAQNAELRAAKERLTEADRLKSEFMGMMSHELRTPLNHFIGYVEILLDAATDGSGTTLGERRDVLERLLDASHTLTRLVEDTLSVLRLETAGVRLSLETIAVGSLFAELQAAERFLAASAAVTEQWCVEPELPALISDRLKLRQVVTNLVGNARKFTRAGSITIRAAGLDAERLAITVEDTGCGIAPAELPFIFDLYRQATNGEAHNGCGIGLYIVQRYCELLGGSVEVASELGKGTRFTVVLPHRPSAVATGETIAAIGPRLLTATGAAS